MDYAKEREVRREMFCKHFNITENDMTSLWRLFMDAGMTKYDRENEWHNKANHYFLQGICEHREVEWSTWCDSITYQVKLVIENRYPQLMCDNKEFSNCI